MVCRILIYPSTLYHMRGAGLGSSHLQTALDTRRAVRKTPAFVAGSGRTETEPKRLFP